MALVSASRSLGRKRCPLRIRAPASAKTEQVHSPSLGSPATAGSPPSPASGRKRRGLPSDRLRACFDCFHAGFSRVFRRGSADSRVSESPGTPCRSQQSLQTEIGIPPGTGCGLGPKKARQLERPTRDWSLEQNGTETERPHLTSPLFVPRLDIEARGM